MTDTGITFTLYGIKNCDTIKKARRWLDERQINYRFHDYRVNGVDEELLNHFAARVGWRALVNTRGATWRGLSEEQRAAADQEREALLLMVRAPALIKRPILQTADGRILLGFDADGYHAFIHQEG